MGTTEKNETGKTKKRNHEDNPVRKGTKRTRKTALARGALKIE